MSDWQPVRLGDAADFTLGFPFKSARFTEAVDDVRLLRGDNVAQRRVRWDNAKRWPRAEFDELGQFHLASGDIILAMDRPWIEAGLKWAVLRPEDCPSLLVQRVLRLRARPGASQRFLSHVVGSPAFTEHVQSVQTGTAVPHISGRQVADFAFSLPSLDEQEQIAEALSTLDDKIELNRRMNETLEAMAQAIFRDWFVDFGPVRRQMEGATDPVAIMGGLTPNPARAAELAALFPAALGEDGLPEGWREGNFSMLANTAGESVNPAQLGSETPYIGLEHMPRRSIMLDSWDHAGKVSSQKSRFARGQVLFGKLRPYFHKVGLAPCDGVCSTDIVVLDSREPFDRALVASCASSDAFVAFTDQSSTGTKMPRTSWAHMKTYEVAVADEPVRRAFEVVVGPMHEKIIASVAENRTLAETRDYLLPRLMSGAVRVGHTAAQDAAA